MTFFGRIRGQQVDDARNVQSGKVRLLTVELASTGHTQTAQLVPQAGEDYCPPDGATALCIRVGRRMFVLATFDGVEPSVAAGERLIYSTDGNGAVKASVHLKADGEIVITSTGGKSVKVNGNLEVLP